MVLLRRTYDYGILLMQNPCRRTGSSSRAKQKPDLAVGRLLGTPGRIRTYDLELRSLLLYPTELPGHCTAIITD